MITKPLIILLLLGLLEQAVFAVFGVRRTIQECVESDDYKAIGSDCFESGAYKPDKLYPLFINYLEKLLDDHPEKLDWYGQGYKDIANRFGQLFAKTMYEPMIDNDYYCRDGFIKYKDETGFEHGLKKVKRIANERCMVHFFYPIIGVIALYQNPTSRYQPFGGIATVYLPRMDALINEIYIDKNDWEDNGKWVKKMATLMKKALTKVQEKEESNLFTREMIYTKLNRVAPNVFPSADSPFQKYNVAEKWYNYARNEDGTNLRRLFDLQVDTRVVEFCTKEISRTPLCSFAAIKNKYDLSLLYLPEPPSSQSDSKPPTAVSISAYYGENGYYSTVKGELDEIMKMDKFTATIKQLGNRLSKYFATLAGFDNAIAKADVEFVERAIKMNNESLEAHIKNMDAAVKAIRGLKSTCAFLNAFEIAVKISFAIAATIATAGAAAPAAAATAAVGVEEGFKIVETAAKGVNDMYDNNHELKEIKDNVNGVQGEIGKIMKKFMDNKKQMDDMSLIVKAVLTDGSTFSSTQAEVQGFLKNYSNYKSAVRKEDLAQLNNVYTKMLTSFNEQTAGFLCKIFVGKELGEKTDAAKLAWDSIYSLLGDILEQQFQLKTALVRVVRSKLDQSAAKEIEANTNYNFEIIVRQMLDVRVAAQHTCNIRQLMNNNVPDDMCESIRNKVFLSSGERNALMGKEETVKGELKALGNGERITNERLVYLPVSGKGSSPGVINWDNLLDEKGADFVLLADKKFLKDNGWTDHPTDLGLLRSLQLFLPNVYGRKRSVVRFTITAIQDNIRVNGNPSTQLYTFKSKLPVQTHSTYTLNEGTCLGRTKDDMYVKDTSSTYCIPNDSGRLIKGTEISLPVSMYSKFHFHVQLDDDNMNRQDLRNNYRPIGDTLKLRGIIEIYSNPAGGFTPRPMGKHRKLPKSMLPQTQSERDTEPCADGYYRRIIDTSVDGQVCTKCPPGSRAVGHGSYCAVEVAETAVKV